MPNESAKTDYRERGIAAKVHTTIYTGLFISQTVSQSSIMGSCISSHGGTPEERARDKAINKELQGVSLHSSLELVPGMRTHDHTLCLTLQQAEKEKKTVRVLLLGAGDSGKSTVVKVCWALRASTIRYFVQ